MDKTKKTQHGAAKKRKAAHRVFALLISALVVIGIAFAAVLIIKRINTVARVYQFAAIPVYQGCFD